MTPHQASVARERAALLLAGLVRDGVRDLEAVRAVPPLAEVLPEHAALERLAAAHHRVFRLEAPSVESFWLSPDRLLGGPGSEAVAEAYRLGGFVPRLRDVPADHLGVQLAYVAWLAGARAEALEDGRLPEAGHLLALEQAFLADHLLRWLPALAVAIEGLDPLFERVIELALTLARSVSSGGGSWALPALPELEDPDTRLRDIARVLCTPALCGGLLTRSALAELGRADRLPAGFGGREQTLANLLRSAGRFDALPGLWHRLRERFAGLGQAGGPWAVRCEETRELLDRLEERRITPSRPSSGTT